MRLEQRPGNIPLSKRQSGSTISLDAKGGPKDLGPACRKFEGFLLGELFKEMREAESSSRGIIPVSRASGWASCRMLVCRPVWCRAMKVPPFSM